MDNILELDIYVGCIEKIKPNSNYGLSINDNDEKTITWYDTDQTEPTTGEISSIRDTVISELLYALLRKQRNEKMLKTDFYFVNDFAHKTDEKRQEWLAYRQALRDLPNNQTPQIDSDGNLTNVTWPTEPTGS